MGDVPGFVEWNAQRDELLVKEAVTPLLDEIDSLGTTVAQRNERIAQVEAEVARVSGLLEQATGALILEKGAHDALKERYAALERELAACKASHQPPARKMLLGAATAPKGGTTAQRVEFTRKFKADIEALGGTFSFIHTFSGTTIPTAFGVGSPDNAVPKSFPGLGVMLNFKTPNGDWAGVPSGKYRTAYIALLDSLLAWVKANGGRVYLTGDHEPENDHDLSEAKRVAPLWRRAQAWYAIEFYKHEIANHGDYYFTVMSWTYETRIENGVRVSSSKRDPEDWNVLRDLPSELHGRIGFGIDVYFKAQDSVEVNWNQRGKPVFDWGRARSLKMAVFEWAVNNDAMVPEAQRGAVVAGMLEHFEEYDVEAAGYYPHPGPAAGQNPGPGPDGMKALAAASR